MQSSHEPQSARDRNIFKGQYMVIRIVQRYDWTESCCRSICNRHLTLWVVGGGLLGDDYAEVKVVRKMRRKKGECGATEGKS